MSGGWKTPLAVAEGKGKIAHRFGSEDEDTLRLHVGSYCACILVSKAVGSHSKMTVSQLYDAQRLHLFSLA